MTHLLGIIADDYTGATDIASTLVKQGMRVTQFLGLPVPDSDPGDVEAVVIALKSRTIPVAEAVEQSLKALDWLRDHGAERILFKYCSTFDSTADGNIGPVADALMDALDTRFALICPAFPDNRRRVYQGYLFVGNELLEESPMRHHPLTPMRDSSLPRLMRAQSRREVGLVPHEIVQAGRTAVAQTVEQLIADDKSYGVVDALSNADIDVIGAVATDHRLVTGGSAIAAGIAAELRQRGGFETAEDRNPRRVEGRALILAGSCSAATLAQIDAAPDHWPAYRIEAKVLQEKPALIDEIVELAQRAPASTPVLVYASTRADELAQIQAELGTEASAALIENALASIATRLVDTGFRHLVVAGGETSGAVLSALAIDSLEIGCEIDPGVPWTFTRGEPALALALKSGNFGRVDFFRHALEQLRPDLADQ